ncbi:DNA topoisomerase IB [Roseibacillus persicicus]|uniref:DNA topoisomerase n=1 Tax=Roseibacillus persicicus TaxID=454148 RepID=A0A918TRI3_9BACT|nr:DNA topoisomerase IB [Roseibacillus persicicus]GHC57825.1 DNA topoisomerase [Roseibacillus persicicus]
MNATTPSLPPNLVYSHDGDSGFRRKGAGRGFAYYDKKGKLVKDPEIKQRLQALAIPPAYQEVWFCENPQGHLQATGIDERGRKQYRYHPDWTAWRDRQKFDSLLPFAKTLPKIRNAVRAHLDCDSLSKDSVIAAVVRLLDKTALRIGNEVYQQENGTTGLTTLKSRHVETHDGYLQLNFRAKGGERREFELYLPTIASVVEKLDDLPGQRLFQYRHADDETLHPITSTDINEWLKEVSNLDISAKDFRTWRASQLTLSHLLQHEPAKNKAETIKQENSALKATSLELGHRPPVCRKHYVHPMILEAHREGALQDYLSPKRRLNGLSTAENKLLSFLTKIA